MKEFKKRKETLTIMIKKYLIVIAMLLAAAFLISGCNTNTASEQVEDNFTDSIEVDDYVDITKPVVNDQNQFFFSFTNTSDKPVEITSFTTLLFSDDGNNVQDISGDVIYAPVYVEPGETGYGAGTLTDTSGKDIEVLANYIIDPEGEQIIDASVAGENPVMIRVENTLEYPVQASAVAALMDESNNLIGVAYQDNIALGAQESTEVECSQTVLSNGYSLSQAKHYVARAAVQTTE